MSEQWNGARVVQQEDEHEYRDGSGWTTYRVWICDKASAVPYARSMVAGGYTDVSVTSQDNVIFKVRCGKPGLGEALEEIADQWEILPVVQTMDILNHPVARTGIVQSDLEELQWCVAHKDELAGRPNFVGTGTYLTNANALWAVMKNNPSGYEWSTYHLRNTRTTGNYSEVMVSYAGVGKTHTFTSVLSKISADFPAIRSSILAIQTAGYPLTVPSGFTWGWLKKAPTRTQALNRKYQATEEWVLDAWADVLYPPA